MLSSTSFFFTLLPSRVLWAPTRAVPARASLPGDFDAELAVLSLPARPSPELTPQAVVCALCLGLQHNNLPTPDAGLRRLFEFSTYECRASLTSRKGYKSGPDKFVEHVVTNLWTLVGARSFSLCGEPTVNAGTATRGAFAVAAVDVEETLGFRFASGHERGQEGRGGPDTRTERYRFLLCQERRPPLTGCWTVQSVLPMRQHVIFDGDTGAVQG